VAAGSAEVFLLKFYGDLGVLGGIYGLILPIFVGNIIGGTGLFAMIAPGPRGALAFLPDRFHLGISQ
jgi:hypothetical protein